MDFPAPCLKYDETPRPAAAKEKILENNSKNLK